MYGLCDHDLTVSVINKNGLRYVNFHLVNGIHGYLPQQSIVYANLGHVKVAKQPDFDFGTDFLELTEYKGKKFLEDPSYRKEQLKNFTKKVKDNPGKVLLFVLNGSKTSLKFTKQINKILIDFQVKCGFKFVKGFIKSPTNAMEDYRYCRSLVPKKCKFVAQIDENINHNIFKQIYLDCYEERNDELICFFGRKPSKTQRHSRFNFNFIRRRREDKIIRFTSSTARKNDVVASSLVYYYYGFDVFSILARIWNPEMPKDLKLEALNGMVFERLTKNTKLVCPLTNQNLHTSSKYFKEKKNRESLPVHVHTVYNLNHILKDLHKSFSSEDLKEILADRLV